YLWNADGAFVNLRMVEQGYARAVLYEPNNRYWDVIKPAERAVKRARRGLWGACARFGAPAEGADSVAPAPVPGGAGGGAYPVPAPPPDRDCSAISARNFRVRPGDPHRFDSDGNGIGCEG